MRNKLNLFSIIFLTIIVVGLVAYISFVKARDEKLVADVCKNFSEEKKLDQGGTYLALRPSNDASFSFFLQGLFNPRANNIQNAAGQYAACRLMLTGQKDIFDQSFAFYLKSTASEKAANFLAFNDFFKKDGCDSLSKEEVNFLRSKIKDGNIDLEKACLLMRNGGSREEIGAACGEDRDCFMFLGRNKDLYDQLNPQDPQDREKMDGFNYLSALRAKDESFCEGINFVLPRTACHVYFHNDLNYCDALYIEVRKAACQ